MARGTPQGRKEGTWRRCCQFDEGHLWYNDYNTETITQKQTDPTAAEAQAATATEQLTGTDPESIKSLEAPMENLTPEGLTATIISGHASVCIIPTSKGGMSHHIEPGIPCLKGLVISMQ